MATRKRKKSDGVVTVSQAAKSLGLSAGTIRGYCRAGLVGQSQNVFGQEWYILTAEEVEWLRNPNNRPAMGRPPKESAGAA